MGLEVSHISGRSQHYHGVTVGLLGAGLPLLLEWECIKRIKEKRRLSDRNHVDVLHPCRTVVIHGGRGFSVFHVSKSNSLRSNLACSHQHQTGARPPRSLSMAEVGQQRICQVENHFRVTKTVSALIAHC